MKDGLSELQGTCDFYGNFSSAFLTNAATIQASPNICADGQRLYY